MGVRAGRRGGRNEGRRRRRWEETCRMKERRGRVVEGCDREKCSWRVSSKGWKMMRAIREPVHVSITVSYVKKCHKRGYIP
jgi:hypothetical protein